MPNTAPVLLLLLASLCTPPSTPAITGLNELLDSLHLKYAPDDRIELWDVHVHVHVHAVQGALKVQGNLSSQKTYHAVKQTLEQQYPEVDNQLKLLPKTETGSLVNALVNNSVIQLRREPSSATELVTQALLGAPVRILKTEKGKSLIQVPDGDIGWVNTALAHDWWTGLIWMGTS